MAKRSAHFASIALLLCACGPESNEGWSYSDSTERVPIVLIVLDAMHAGHVSHLGYDRLTTPNIDALAQAGTSFLKAFAPTPYTLASIPTILTGRHPDRHGVTQPGSELPAHETTLAEVLGRAGYKTHAMVGNLQGSSLHALEQGFEVYEELFRGAVESDAGPASGTVRIPTAFEYLPVLKNWTQANDERPPFYYMHFLEPHMPYDPPAEFRSRFLDSDYRGPFEDGANGGEDEREATSPKRRNRAIHRNAVRALYDAHLAFVDDHVGQVLEHLKSIGLYERALIILTSDHGESLWQHGHWGHSTQVYDEMLHVPLVVKWPAEFAIQGQRIDELTSLMDITPTICEALGISPPEGRLQGVSLIPLARADSKFSRAASDRKLISRTNHEVAVMSLRSDTRKTILTRDQETGEAVLVEHYDLLNDPNELRDLGPGEHSAADVETLLKWARGAYQTAPSTDRELTDAEREHLGDLGYIGD
ncbi:MAG: arylsulfatase A-like enzyme [Planctomycetota bacterium]